MGTTPNVFIVESLDFEDEEKEHTEGKFISHILRLAGRQVRYVYIRTSTELRSVMEQFEDSGFRYLHFSCHGSKKEIALTLDRFSAAEFGALVAPSLDKRRVFFSACGVATPVMASALLNGTGCYSMVGPSESVFFDESALYWASLYHLLFKDDAQVVKRKDLSANMAKLSGVFPFEIKYFAASKTVPKGFNEVRISNGKSRSKM
jgi:hypothetical protein